MLLNDAGSLYWGRAKLVRAYINYKGGIEGQHNNGRLSGFTQIYLQPVHERCRLRWHSLPHVGH